MDGTGIYVMGTASTEGGILTFNLDGTTSTFDRYSKPPYKCGIPYFSQSALPNTNHQLTVTLTGNSPENSTTEGFLEWSWLLYTVPDPQDTLSPSSAAGASSTLNGSAAPASASSSHSPGPTGNATSKSSNAAAIGGGIAAGVVIFAIVAGLLWWYCRRHKTTTQFHGKPDLDGPSTGMAETGMNYGIAPSPPAVGQSEPRTSFAFSPGASTQAATTWTPDVLSAASLSPMTQPQSLYAPTTAHPQGHLHQQPSFASTAPLVPTGAYVPGNPANSSYNLPNPHAEVNPYYSPSSAANSSGSASGIPPSAPPPGHIPESDVERIAARVATMMSQQTQVLPVGAGAPEYDQPPPMYNEKR
ncbi:hypothetical protein FRB99_006320 [Tulasnella sp. 403]|nr:hypothetical protein FRB99_006320 [Tulasnella sp. 403]